MSRSLKELSPVAAAAVASATVPYVAPRRPLGVPTSIGTYIQKLKADPNRPLDNPALVIIVIARRDQLEASKSFQANSIAIWPPKGAGAFELGSEMHFVFTTAHGTHAYILPRDLALCKRLKRLRREPEYPVTNLEHGGITSKMALCYGDKLTLEEYKERYAHCTWVPTTQEYLTWLASLETNSIENGGGGLSFAESKTTTVTAAAAPN